MIDKKHSLVITIIIALIIIPSFIVWVVTNLLNTPAQTFGDGHVEFEVYKGGTLSQIAENLEAAGLIENVWKFKWAARLMGAERKIQPGEFLLSYGLTNAEVINYLLRPGAYTKNVTIPEGLTIRQIAGILKQELNIDSVEFIRLCEDSIFTSRLGIASNRLEGYLFPDTYNFFKSSTEVQIIRRMTSHFSNVFDGSFRRAAEQLDLTVHQAVTLASIIEGEVIKPDEARVVSAVYHNRLKRGMLLGADPTIQYIIPDGPRRLLNGDLEIDSPYNTYKHRGLPPGPINNPGKIALEAAVNPANVDYIYFVARGDGSHAFNSTHAGHRRDKAKLQKIRRQVARKKRTESRK